MSRITGKNALELFEAYQSVYTPQELTEEQVWEEVESWVNSLLKEGYDLSDYTWEDMYEAYVDEERAPGVKPYRGTATQAKVRENEKEARRKHVASGKDKPGYSTDDKKFSDWKMRVTPDSTLKRKKKEGGTEEETVSQRMNREHPYKTRMTGPLARRLGSRAAANVDRVVTGAGEPQAVTYPRKGSKVSKEIIRREHLDLYDAVLFHLLDEGYATSVEAAEKIMVNMSEEWIDSICEDFQQLDEISDAAVERLKKGVTKRTDRAQRTSALGLTQSSRERAGDVATRGTNRESRINQRIASRNQRTGSNVEPIFTRRHQ